MRYETDTDCVVEEVRVDDLYDLIIDVHEFLKL